MSAGGGGGSGGGSASPPPPPLLPVTTSSFSSSSSSQLPLPLRKHRVDADPVIFVSPPTKNNVYRDGRPVSRTTRGIC